VTAPDRKLEESRLFDSKPLVLYRLARTKYADLSGLGAALSPGRWNRRGQEAIYTSTEIGVTVLERLVHTPKNRIPDDLALMKIQLVGDWLESPDLSLIDELPWPLRKDSYTYAFFRVLPSLEVAKKWFGKQRRPHGIPSVLGSTIAIAVPSVVVPVWNVVLYPASRDFWTHVSLLSVEPFDYDPRLFPEGTPWDDESK
jgi:RES domain-containing protein